MLYAYCDASITGGPWAKRAERSTTQPHSFAGWLIKDAQGARIHHHALDVGEGPTMSANVGEFAAVRSALAWLAKNHRDQSVVVHSDSQITIGVMSGAMQCHNERLARMAKHIKGIAALFPAVIWKWIPREQNKEADALSRCLWPQNGGVVPPLPTKEGCRLEQVSL